MSHFYGKLDGTGPATRCGTKKSGITSHAAGWQGAIRVEVWHDSEGKDQFAVYLAPWEGSGGTTALLAEGELDANRPCIEQAIAYAPPPLKVEYTTDR